ncbi:hypothetical protein ACQ4M3_05670 [Leptolyngbya sp. AN03gr2]|uniref:hypothetical protein n=1 Tax=unclassified Leptolyngbya TaxID=2650499 RepID=UPI003D31316F
MSTSSSVSTIAEHHDSQHSFGVVEAHSTSQASLGDSQGSSIHHSDVNKALDQSLESSTGQGSVTNSNSGSSDTQDSLDQTLSPSEVDENFLHIDPSQLENTKTLDPNAIQTEPDLADRLGNDGDFLDPGGGDNTVIGAGGNDIIVGNGGGFNTITTSDGRDLIILGVETTDRIFDFDPNQDQFGLTGDLTAENLLLGQGKNATKAGIDQPLDSENNAVLIDQAGGNHVVASLTFVDAQELSERNFANVDPQQLSDLSKDTQLFASQQTQSSEKSA